MKKINFSKDYLKDKFNYIKAFLKKHYINFFKGAPLLFCFIATSLLNTLLLRIITVGNFTYLKPLFIDLGMLCILSAFMFL